MTATPGPVSPAPDADGDSGLALRVEIAKRLARHDAELWGYDHGFTAYGSDDESDSFVTTIAKLIEEREASLRAEVQRLEQRVAEQHEPIQGWAAYGERVKAKRAKYGDMLIDALGLRDERVGRHFDHLVPQACEEITKLRAESARVSRIPDDEAVEKLARWLFRMTGRRQGEPLYGDGAAPPERQEKRWNTWLEDEDRDRLREMARVVLADLGATPTTDPAPAPIGYLIAGPSDEDARAGRASDPADLDPGGWDGVVHTTIEDGQRSLASCHAHGYVTGWKLYALTEVVPPAAPQDPAQPTAKQCNYCTSPREDGYSACEYHVGQISLYGLSGLAARVDAAHPDVHEMRVEMADRLHSVWELATAATRDGRGLTVDQAARIEHLADIRHPLDAGDLA